MGVDFAILSKARKSHMKGAQYLHRPIMGASQSSPFQVDYRMVGSPAAYRFKVYGRMWDGTVSPEDLAEPHSGWDIREAYDRLWDNFGDMVLPWEASAGGLHEVVLKNNPDVVISSIPAPILCHRGHSFRASNIWSSDKDMGAIGSGEDNIVVCNGEEAPRWYRVSRIQGWNTVEWPDGAKPPITPMWQVPKPLDHNCDCFPNLVRVGRYGKWQKGVLSHEAWDATVDAIKAKS